MYTCVNDSVFILDALNTSVVSSTKKTPFEVVFGQRPNMFHFMNRNATMVANEDIVAPPMNTTESTEGGNLQILSQGYFCIKFILVSNSGR